MSYEEMESLKKGNRLKVWVDGKYLKGTFISHLKGADSAIWIAFDKDQLPGEKTYETKVYTGMQFNPEYWNDRQTKFGYVKKFVLLTEEELNEELLSGLGA